MIKNKEKNSIIPKASKLKKSIITKNISTNHFEYTYIPVNTKNNNLDNVSPLIEIFRYNETRKLANDISKYFRLKKFELSSQEALQIIKSIIFTEFNFIESNEIEDPLIPYNASHFIPQNKISLFNKFKNFTEDDYNDWIEKFNIIKKLNNIIVKIKKYKKSNLYKRINKEYKIIFTPTNNNFIILQIVHNDINIKIPLIKIHNYLYNKLKNQYIYYCKKNNISYTKDIYEKLFASLLLRYETMDIQNEQLACDPEFYQNLKKIYKYDYELFGSALNTQYTQYNSIFYDIEKYFLSNGNFYGVKPYKGFYVANPPFFEDMIYNIALLFEKWLDENNNRAPLSFFITIPAWVSDEKYGIYRGYEFLKKSKYLKFIKRINKYKSHFFDYYHHKIVYPCPIYFILIENKLATEIKNKMNKNYSIEKMIDLYFTKPNKYKNKNYIPKIIHL